MRRGRIMPAHRVGGDSVPRELSPQTIIGRSLPDDRIIEMIPDACTERKEARCGQDDVAPGYAESARCAFKRVTESRV